ncbi:hypothetical protein [Arenimonas sp.]|uniref:hypothetical protein n=1 Tax=Arenimonas sp. TaxID=1872635 RepID=UPI0039E4F37D
MRERPAFLQRSMLALLALALVALPALAAINPAEYQRVASDVLRIHETARIVHESNVDGQRIRRVTIVGEILEDRSDASQKRLGRTVVIDYSTDLSAREAAGKQWAAERGAMPGPQFMHDPDPPKVDAEGNFWAHLAPVGTRLGNVQRHAGAVATLEQPVYEAHGEVFVPAAGQYSFDAPMR